MKSFGDRARVGNPVTLQLLLLLNCHFLSLYPFLLFTRSSSCCCGYDFQPPLVIIVIFIHHQTLLTHLICWLEDFRFDENTMVHKMFFGFRLAPNGKSAFLMLWRLNNVKNNFNGSYIEHNLKFKVQHEFFTHGFIKVSIYSNSFKGKPTHYKNL